MAPRRIRRETRNRHHISLSKLAEDYFITCDAEGKLPSAVRGYNEKLGRFVRWAEDATLSDFSVELAREYIREGYTDDNVLARLKILSGPRRSWKLSQTKKSSDCSPVWTRILWPDAGITRYYASS